MLKKTAYALFAAVASFSLAGAVDSASAEEVVFAGGYGGIFDDLLYKEVIPAFEKQTGIKVKLVSGSGLGMFTQILASRNNPEIDVYWASELTHAGGKALGVYEKLDPKVVSNLSNVQTMALDPDGVGVTAFISALGLMYNKKAFDDAGIPAPASWKDLWDPRLKSKVALLSIGITFTPDFLAMTNRLEGGDENDVSKGIAKIAELKAIGNVGLIANSPSESENALMQGSAWVTYGQSNRAYVLKSTGSPLEFVLPKEGGTMYSTKLDIVKGAPNPEAAQKFVNFFISPEVQAILAKRLAVAPAVRNVEMPPELVGKIPHTEEDLSKLVQLDRTLMNQNLDGWTDAWNREIEAR